MAIRPKTTYDAVVNRSIDIRKTAPYDLHHKHTVCSGRFVPYLR